MRNQRAEVMHDDVAVQPLPRRRTPYSETFSQPVVPISWCSYLAYLLTVPELSRNDAHDFRAWMAWRVLPRRFWSRVQAVAATLPSALPYDIWAS